MSSDVRSIADKFSRLDLILGVIAVLAAAFLFGYGQIQSNAEYQEYAAYCLAGAGFSFLMAWIKPGKLFAGALERKMIRKRAPRQL